MTLRDAIRELVKDIATKKFLRIGKAINIDTDKCICDVDLGNGAILHNVKLKAIEGDKNKGLAVFPKQDTMVCAAMLEGIEANWTLIQYSEIESWQIVTNSCSKITVTDNGEVHLNGKKYKGLVKIEELVDKLRKLEEKHDALVDEFNNHTHVHAITGGTSTTNTILPPSINKIGTQTEVSDLENDKVFHGNGE